MQPAPISAHTSKQDCTGNASESLPYNMLSRLTRGMILLLLMHISACDTAPDNNLSLALGDQNTEGFLRAKTIRPFHFPEDHSAHPGFKNEWWYLTGNLISEQGNRFGYQVTFFRVALSPEAGDRQSRWATDHIWMAHAAISDLDNERHLHAERLSRGAAGLAGNRSEPFRVWLDDWQIQSKNSSFPWSLHIDTENFSLFLEIDPQKPVVLQGDRGLSQKSPEPGNASYYYSITRLKTKGSVRAGKRTFEVTGNSWLDREWGTSLLAKDQIGWDWFSLQFDSNQELMYYQLRKPDGSAHSSSKGIWVNANGRYQAIAPEEIQLTPLDWWTAPNGSKYPIRWRMGTHDKDWIVEAAIANQWMNVSIKYWEGAVVIYDRDDKKPVGRGYLEMTGY